MKAVLFEQSNGIWSQLHQGLSDHLLSFISTHRFCRFNQIYSEALRLSPISTRPNILYELVVIILDWFELRGDIIKGARKTYHCLPPYVLYDHRLSKGNTISVYGDPMTDKKLIKTLSDYATFESELIYKEDIENGGDKIVNSIPVGIERTLFLKKTPKSDFKIKLENIGITVLNPSSLRESIPKADELFWPPKNVFIESPILTGNWEIYDSSIKKNYQAGRWSLEPDWQKSTYRLLRFSPGTEYTYRDRRYFLHEGGLIFEISQDEAQWWQFKLDLDLKNPTIWFLKIAESELWINGRIPFAINRWLRFIVSKPPKRLKYYYIFTLPPEQINEVKLMTSQNLGVKIITTSN